MIAKQKVCFTLRLKNDLSQKIHEKAKELGISVNAYITMILVKEVLERK